MIQILQIIILILELIARGMSKDKAIEEVWKANNVSASVIRSILNSK